MRQKNNKTKLILLLFTACALLSCEDKNYYDPDKQNENPLEITAPSGFEWQTTRSTNVRVEANDEFNGEFNYLIEIFDKNPVIDASAKLITNGTAKNGHPFTTKIALPVNVEGVYIKQTTPTGLVSARYADVTNGSININFGDINIAANRSMKSAGAVTRATNPEKPTITSDMFPTTAPSNTAELISGSNGPGTANAYKDYILNSNISGYTIGRYVNIYVTEDVTISHSSSNWYRNIYILPGKTLTINDSFGFSSIGNIISVGEGAKLIVTGSMVNTGEGNGVYNKGIITVDGAFTTGNTAKVYNIGENSDFSIATNMSISANAQVFNEGKMTIGGTYKSTNTTLAYNEGTFDVRTLFHNETTFINDNILTCKKALFTGTPTTTNNKTVVIEELSEFNSPGTWVNNGTWTTNTMTTVPTATTFFNTCKLIINEKATWKGGTITNDGGAYIYAKALEMDNTRVEMGSEAYFHIDGEGKFYENRINANENEGFHGLGDKYALLKVTNVVQGGTLTSPNMISYRGKLGIVCKTHPERNMPSGSVPRWSDDEYVLWGEMLEDGSNNISVEIPANGECNPGSSPKPDPNPGDKDPDPIVDPFSYSYLFEDLWPFYGDYDMNDAVILINKITKNINKDGTINSLAFDYSLKAVGAGSSLGGALMLDAINASDVSGVTYSSKTPSGFETTSAGVESGQDKAVIPLFANAHNFLGRNPGQFVNTVKGSNTNVSDVPTITVTITFAKAIADEFDATTFNTFIIPTSAGVITSTNRKEVHMLGYSPSKRANTSLFGNNDDRSSSSKYYVSRDNLSWAIVVPDEFRWPIEYKSIKLAYSGFANWVQTGGTENKDWWLTPANEEFVY